jgi:hypothetical protein
VLLRAFITSFIPGPPSRRGAGREKTASSLKSKSDTVTNTGKKRRLLQFMMHTSLQQ